MLGMGLQHKTVDTLAKELDLPATQLLGLFNRTIRKILDYMNGILESGLEKDLSSVQDRTLVTSRMVPVVQTLAKELDAGAEELRKKQAKELERLKKADLSQYVIKGSDDAWSDALGTSKQTHSLTIKVGEKRLATEVSSSATTPEGKKQKKGERGGKAFGKGWKKPKGRKGDN